MKKIYLCPFTRLESAKHHVRELLSHINIGLATYDQMIINNAMWDNL